MVLSILLAIIIFMNFINIFKANDGFVSKAKK